MSELSENEQRRVLSFLRLFCQRQPKISALGNASAQPTIPSPAPPVIIRGRLIDMQVRVFGQDDPSTGFGVAI
jgi:hypothetical protein